MKDIQKTKPFSGHIGILEDTSCWIISGTLGRGGVRVTYKKERHFAHRLAYELANETQLTELDVVRHTCTHINCVNPAHLLVKQKEIPVDTATINSLLMRYYGNKDNWDEYVKDLPPVYDLPVDTIKRVVEENKKH